MTAEELQVDVSFLVGTIRNAADYLEKMSASMMNGGAAAFSPFVQRLASGLREAAAKVSFKEDEKS